MGLSMFSGFIMFMRILYFLLLVHILVLITISSFTLSQPLCHDLEKNSLLQFKGSFTIEKFASSDPIAYPKVSYWRLEGEKSDCCFWDGVECDEETGHVISLDLSSSFLYGRIDSNSSLSNLVYLRRLNLADNHFNHSHIPFSIFKHLSSLTYLNLSMSYFSGQIPSEISTLSKLAALDLSSNVNKVSGEKLLHLKEPNFESLIQNLTSLEELSLSHVDISSAVPDFLVNVSTLTSLVLTECRLAGEFPSGIFELPNLEILSVMFNKDLIGKLPLFKQTSSLKVLKLAGTSFSGDFPSSIENLHSLRELDISDSNFSGLIPYSIGNLNQLTFLDLSGNKFRGHVPSSLANLTQLTEMRLQNNQLTGPIPHSFTRLINLEILRLNGNFFSGEVNIDMFLGLKYLTHLFLSDNNLSVISKPSINGSLPNGTMAQFINLVLKSCNLTNFPDFLRHQERLEWLSLRGNQIHGRIPKWMLNTSIETLTELDISENLLTGFEQLPLVLPWTNLEVLTISFNIMEGPLPIPPPSTIFYEALKNYFTGELPSSICSLHSLHVLNLSLNRLSGELPQCLGNFSNSLSFLQLTDNSFHGTIPQTFTNESQLMVVDLSHNKLQGKLPRSLANCKMLKYLALENNQFIDIFPYWLGTLPELQILVLRSNGFHGPIGEPQSNSDFSELRIIDVSNNSFVGELPSEYFKIWKALLTRKNVEESKYLNANKSLIPGWSLSYNFRITITIKGVDRYYEQIQDVIAVIDLSSNKFDGEIPTVIGNLKGLYSLDLSNNKLTGGIPSSLENLKELESLDLSQNKLSGEIPQELTKLTFLQFFNVSHNRLTGPIPQGNQLGTFESTSYEGNLGLCGIPLPNKCGNSGAPPSSASEEEEEDSGSLFQFGWKVVAIGYGCGFLVGLFTGKITIARKPRWFAFIFGVKNVQELEGIEG